MDMDQPLKMYFIPYLEAGHMIPHCDIANHFASRGHHVTIITTHTHARRISPARHPNFRVHTVHIPSGQVEEEDGGIKAVSNATEQLSVYEVSQLLRKPVEEFVERHPPDCISADLIMMWAEGLANKLRIPRLAFDVSCLFSICCNLQTIKGPHPIPLEEAFVVENLPHRLVLKAPPPLYMTWPLEPIYEAMVRSIGVIVNNFEELDGKEYVEYYERTTGHKAWHLGPASLFHKTAEEKAARGQKSVVRAHECITWLDSKPLNSVLYICFGSLCHFPDNQLYEIACAVEASGCEFVWVVPEKNGKEEESEEEKDKWLPKGFEKKGMIIRGWAPQVLILGHPALGAFLTHCGWNSTLEAISAGVPMITWPVHSEQFFNEKLISEVRGIGVEVGAEEWTNTGFEERKKLIGRDCIEKAIRRLMDGGDEAREIRWRAQELGNKARVAVEEGGSSHQNLTNLIHQLKRLRASSSKVVEE